MLELARRGSTAIAEWARARSASARRSLADIASSPMLPLATGAIAIGVFLIDTITTLEIAIAVVYVVVVLLAAVFLRRRGVLVVAAICIALTVLSYVLTHEISADAALMRGLVSLAAIGIASALALMNQSAHAVLREQASLLDLTHDTIFVRGMDDVITYWNRGAEVLYGWSKEQAIGQVSHDLMRTIFPAPRDEITAQLMQTGRWEGELVHTTRDGTQVVVASRWSLQRDESGRPAAILETNTDITAAKRAEAALQRAQAELAHVSRVTMLGELSASIAHEVNQPLAAIVLNAEGALRFLDHKPAKLDEARQATSRIVRSAERASNVIRRIRGLSKKATSETTQLNVNDVIEETIPLVRSQAISNRVTLRLQLTPGLPAVLADRIQLQQVIINLMINAIDAMKPVVDRPRELTIRSQLSKDGQVLVAAQDTGVGIEPDKMDQLFEAFFTTKADGMGMGLSICRSIIEAHGGRIWASENASQGTTVQFTLPAAAIPAAVEHAMASTAG